MSSCARRTALGIVLSLFALTSAQAAPADREARRGTVSATWENDRWAATDRHYTNGFRLNYLSPILPVDHWADDVADALPGLDTAGQTLLGYSFGQSMYTPADTSAVRRVEDDRPYAGWLYGELALMTASEGSLQTLALDIGVVGPWAGGEEVQNAVHRAIDVDTADGWSHQLKNEPGVVLTYEHKWRNIWKLAPGWLELDLMPHVGAAAGNVFTYGAAGATLRIGADLPNDFGAPRIRPSLPGSAYFEPEDSLGLYFFIGGEGRYVLRNIFLDGNTFDDSHGVDKSPLVGEWQFGAVLTVLDVRLAATYVVSTREFRGQEQPDQFGALTASFKF